ncbi:MAG TPA: hypothetical protein VH912_30205 [Streptosporangiaceae bacterium]
MIPPGAGTRSGQSRDPREAIAQLRQQLALHWPGRVYQGDVAGLSVLSITTELTVWCNGREFVWYVEGRAFTHPAIDPVSAAVRIITRLQQLSQREGGGEQRGESGPGGPSGPPGRDNGPPAPPPMEPR